MVRTEYTCENLMRIDKLNEENYSSMFPFIESIDYCIIEDYQQGNDISFCWELLIEITVYGKLLITLIKVF